MKPAQNDENESRKRLLSGANGAKLSQMTLKGDEMSDELKPCPFCGGDAVIAQIGFLWFIGCSNGFCIAAIEQSGNGRGSDYREVAVYDWNLRKAETDLAARLAAQSAALLRAREALSDIEQWSYKVITGNSEAAQFLPHKVNERAHHALTALPEPPTDAK